MKRIAVLTYPVKHRKTYDLLSLLKANGYADVTVYALPFRYHKKHSPIIQHRPDLNFQIPEIAELCSNLGFGYEYGELESVSIDNDHIVLIAGAGILPQEFVDKHIIINSHPGYIPNCRGLDALKWAIAEKQPIGVTTHILGSEVDGGKIIERKIIDIHTTDTFHSVAQRVYENEVTMLVEAIDKIDNGYQETISVENYEIHKRMPRNIEMNLLEMFEQYKRAFAKEVM